MKTTKELKEIVERYMIKIGATKACIAPSDNNDNKDNEADVIAKFSKLNVHFYVHVRSSEDYTDAWALRQILNYDEQHKACFDADLGITNIPWVITTADDFTKEEVKKEAQKRHVRLINGKEFATMLVGAGMEAAID